jgi:hypothetical protein
LGAGFHTFPCSLRTLCIRLPRWRVSMDRWSACGHAGVLGLGIRVHRSMVCMWSLRGLWDPGAPIDVCMWSRRGLGIRARPTAWRGRRRGCGGLSKNPRGKKRPAAFSGPGVGCIRREDVAAAATTAWWLLWRPSRASRRDANPSARSGNVHVSADAQSTDDRRRFTFVRGDSLKKRSIDDSVVLHQLDRDLVAPNKSDWWHFAKSSKAHAR